MDPAEVHNQLEPRRRAARDHQPAFRRGRGRCVEKVDTLRSIRNFVVLVSTADPPNEHTSEGGRDDRGVPYHAESTLSGAQVLKQC